MILRSLNIREELVMHRFPDLMDSQYCQSQKALIEIKVLKQDRLGPDYRGVDMNVELYLGMLHVNWHPISINRLLRFFRYIKLKHDVIEQEK